MNYAFKMMAVVLALGVLVLGVASVASAGKISNCSNCNSNSNSDKKFKATVDKITSNQVFIKTPFSNKVIFRYPEKIYAEYRCSGFTNKIKQPDLFLKFTDNNKINVRIPSLNNLQAEFDIANSTYKSNNTLSKEEKVILDMVASSWKPSFQFNILQNGKEIILGKRYEFKSNMWGMDMKIIQTPINFSIFNDMYVLNSKYEILMKGIMSISGVKYGFVDMSSKGMVSQHLGTGHFVAQILTITKKGSNLSQFQKTECKLITKEILHSSIIIEGKNLEKFSIPKDVTSLKVLNNKQDNMIAELDAANKRTNELERKLASLQSKQKQEQQKIDTDNQQPIINAFTKQNGSNATITGRVTDNTEVAEVLIDGQALQLSSNGTFETKFYIPRTGKTIEIVAFDTKGNKASKTMKIERGNIQQASGPIFDTLNPSGKIVKSNSNALALIIGVADYSRTNANALYADKDAQQFYDYARMKLGIPSSNIKELVNAKADRVEITLAVKDWIARSTKSGKTDIYVFFAGHGLSTADGKDMFLLPYDGLPRLLQDSAIKRDQLFADIQKANPKSVTVFLDTCYSGTTRGTDMLIASRPIAIRALKQSIPNNFTVFSAAAGDQTSKPLEEAKHGMFSYFLMKGMEGDADTNSDNKITARELHAYVKENVTQQSSGSQTPELQGNKDRVLVQFN